MPSPDQHLVTVVGPPLQLPQIDKPTAQDVEKYHGLYCKALLELFDKHKAQYGAADKQWSCFDLFWGWGNVSCDDGCIMP